MHDLDRQQLERYEQEGFVGEYPIGEVTEVQEMELAAQFLELTGEAELEEFLRDLWRSVKAATGDAARSAYNSDLSQNTVIPALMKAAPIVARVAANVVEPGSGAAAADRTTVLADRAKVLADQWLRQELEGLSGEDREFEIARRYIRFAIDALQRALQAPRVQQQVAAEVAVSEAAREHLPGLVPLVPELVSNALSVRGSNGDGRSGRWVRQGSSIVIDLG
jgi:hypothetical protein